MDLFSSHNLPKDRTRLAGAEIRYKNASGILTATTGFMDGFDYSLNPYSGCSFGCLYCYAAGFSRFQEDKDRWGYWVDVKENALELLIKFRKKSLDGKLIYISSVTDPYQPIEKELELTRSLLKELAQFHKPRIVIQTRSPIVTRDIDILSRFSNLQVNMTITTDSERVRKVFEPLCSSIPRRLRAIQEIAEAGIPAMVTLTPLLPLENTAQFAEDLLATGVKNFVVQNFHADKGRFAGGTREEARALLAELEWSDEKYKSAEAILLGKLPNLGIGKGGFTPII